MKCTAEGCDREVIARELCQAHYMRTRRKKSVDSPLRARNESATEDIRTRVEPDVAAKLEAAAKKQKSTVYDVVRNILKRWADRQD